MPLYVSKPAADLSAGLSGGDLIIFRRRLDPIDGYKQILLGDAGARIAFGEPSLQLTEAEGVYEIQCSDFDAVAEATAKCHPIVQQTEFRGVGGARAIVECPVKTMVRLYCRGTAGRSLLQSERGAPCSRSARRVLTTTRSIRASLPSAEHCAFDVGHRAPPSSSVADRHRPAGGAGPVEAIRLAVRNDRARVRCDQQPAAEQRRLCGRAPDPAPPCPGD